MTGERNGHVPALLGKNHGPVVYVQSEHYRLAQFDRVRKEIGAGETFDATALFEQWAKSRFRHPRAFAKALKRVAHFDATVFVLDGAEGWFNAHLLRAIRSERPGAIVIGVQHGLMEHKGLARRRFRSLIADVLWRLGVPVLGAGFGGSNFDCLFVLTDSDARYVRRLFPSTLAVVRPDLLLGLTERQLGGTMFDVVFVDQLIARRDLDFVASVLASLAKSGFRTAFKPHPKDTETHDETRFGETAVLRHDVPLWEQVSTATGVVASYFSTALFEADHYGIATVALRIPWVDPAKYGPFSNSVRPADFETAVREQLHTP